MGPSRYQWTFNDTIVQGLRVPMGPNVTDASLWPDRICWISLNSHPQLMVAFLTNNTDLKKKNFPGQNIAHGKVGISRLLQLL